MNHPSQKALTIARHLLAREADALNSAGAKTSPAFLVSEKLRRPLITLVGATGFRVLLARASTLAKAQTPGLDALQVMPDGSLAGLGEGRDHQSSEAGVVVIAQLLGLLGVFIGENLTLRLLVDVWPDLAALDLTHYGESRNDPTK